MYAGERTSETHMEMLQIENNGLLSGRDVEGPTFVASRSDVAELL
jgi:hypothetical protein